MSWFGAIVARVWLIASADDVPGGSLIPEAEPLEMHPIRCLDRLHPTSVAQLVLEYHHRQALHVQ